MKKHVPERTCIVCRKKGDKLNFIKFVRLKTGEIAIDKTGKLEGRGAYVCRNAECIEKCIRQKSLSRVLKSSMSDELVEELNHLVEELSHGI